jgi:Fe/S biogenesis protein NfuA
MARVRPRLDRLVILFTDTAQGHFRKLIATQGGDGLAIRIRARNPGSPGADCQLEFCESWADRGDDRTIECEGFRVIVDAVSAAWLEGARFDYRPTATGGELAIHAPNLRGAGPGADAPLALRIQHLLDAEINPQLASHGGRVRLDSVGDGNRVTLRFGGGCQGCGMVDVTLKQGVERMLREHFPEIGAVRDATDHASGRAPYYKAQRGSSALG